MSRMHAKCLPYLETFASAESASCSTLGRTQAKAAAAADAIRQLAQGKARVEPVAGNLASLAEVRRLAEDVRRLSPTLDCLVNNAGTLRLYAVAASRAYDML
jgi:NAD(P)-dependent dehydrogenase (short-subunit alcohol dehydrogenase family)